MKHKKIVITGVGVVASNGIGKDAFWQALQEGKSGIKSVSLFDTDFMKSKLAGEVRDFDAKAYLGDKGLRLLDRATKLVNVAAKLALDDASFQVTEENTDRVGVVLGTTLGSVWSISEFDKTALKEGPRYVNPALFPNTVINSPASQISIRFKIKGFNTTISTGFTSAMDALKYACDFIKMGRADAVLVGGAEELCLQTYLGFYKLHFLSGSKQGAPEINCPFDARRNGIVFGEGAAMVLIEDEKAAKSRGAHIYGEITSMGYSFFPFRLNKYHKLGTGLKEAMGKALREADLKPGDIDYISANANSTPEADCIETQAIKEIFGKDAYHTPVSSVKSMVGETFSASGAMQLAAGLASLEKDFVPPTINYEKKETCCDLDYVIEGARKARVRHALLSCFGPSGVNTAVVLSKYEE